MALESRASSVTTRLSSPFLVRFTDRPVAQITSPAPAHTHTPPRGFQRTPTVQTDPSTAACRGPVGALLGSIAHRRPPAAWPPTAPRPRRPTRPKATACSAESGQPVSLQRRVADNEPTGTALRHRPTCHTPCPASIMFVCVDDADASSRGMRQGHETGALQGRATEGLATDWIRPSLSPWSSERNPSLPNHRAATTRPTAATADPPPPLPAVAAEHSRCSPSASPPYSAASSAALCVRGVGGNAAYSQPVSFSAATFATRSSRSLRRPPPSRPAAAGPAAQPQARAAGSTSRQRRAANVRASGCASLPPTRLRPSASISPGVSKQWGEDPKRTPKAGGAGAVPVDSFHSPPEGRTAFTEGPQRSCVLPGL